MKHKKPILIALAVSIPIIRNAITEYLATQYPAIIFTCLPTGELLISESKIKKFTLIIVSIIDSAVCTIEHLQQLHRGFQHMRLLVITHHEDETTLSSLLHCGARGFFMLTDEPEYLPVAINEMLQQGSYTSPRMQQLYGSRGLFHLLHTPAPLLTPHQLEILNLRCQGFTIKKIAQKLKKKDSTIKNILLYIRKKIGVENTEAVIHLADKNGWIKSSP